MRTFDEDDFDSRTTLPRADKQLILQLSDDDFRRGYVGQVPQRHMPRVPEIPGYVKSRRLWPIFLFITLAAASAGLVLGAGGIGSDWRANAATKFAGSVTVTEQSLAQPKKEEPSASAPAPEPAATVKHTITENEPPKVAPAPKPFVPVAAPKIVAAPAPKPVVAPPAASAQEPKSASDDEIVSPPAAKASVEPAPKATATPDGETETPKAAPPKTAATGEDKPEE